MADATIAVVPRNGNKPRYFIGDLSGILLNLPTNRKYYMSLDQSSTETGIYLIDSEFTFHIIGNIERRLQEKYRYYEDIRLFIKRLVKDAQIELFVREQPIPIKNRATPVLVELIGFINTWRSSGSIPEFAEIPDTHWDSIAPQTWKSKMIDKSKGKGRFNKKREIALDIVDRFPELEEYFWMTKASSDYDGFDACGILHGYLEATYGDGTTERVSGTKSYFGSIVVYYRVFSLSQLNNKEILLDGFEVQNAKFGTKVLDMDDKKSLYDNIRLSASRYAFSLLVIKDPLQAMALRWQYDLGIGEDIIVAYVIRKKNIGKTQYEDLKNYYANELVTW